MAHTEYLAQRIGSLLLHIVPSLGVCDTPVFICLLNYVSSLSLSFLCWVPLHWALRTGVCSQVLHSPQSGRTLFLRGLVQSHGYLPVVSPTPGQVSCLPSLLPKLSVQVFDTPLGVFQELPLNRFKLNCTLPPLPIHPCSLPAHTQSFTLCLTCLMFLSSLLSPFLQMSLYPKNVISHPDG